MADRATANELRAELTRAEVEVVRRRDAYEQAVRYAARTQAALDVAAPEGWPRQLLELARCYLAAPDASDEERLIHDALIHAAERYGVEPYEAVDAAAGTGVVPESEASTGTEGR